MEFNLKNLSHKKLHHFNIIEGGQPEEIVATFSELLGFNCQNNINYFYKKYSDVQIEQAREIIQLQNFKHKKNDKSIIVVECNSINHFAQNALLKILEENLVGNFFFLIISDTKNLLPTFLSRAEVFVNSNQELIIPSLDYKKFKSLSISKRLEIINKILLDINKEKITKYQIAFSIQEILSEMKENTIYQKNGKINELKSISKLSSHINDNGAHIKSILEFIAINL